MNKIHLSFNEIEINPGINIDPRGFVFRYDGKILRAISNSARDDVEYLFNSGAVKELQNLELIPKTSISNYSLEKYELILEHEKINVVIYPIEWSFNMLKDAALLVLDVNSILKKYGFETHDSHGYNILFHHSVPKFVDFGSFVRKVGKKYWAGMENFREFYFYSLYIWSKGNSLLAKSFLNNDGKYFNAKDYEFFIYRFSLARILPQNMLKRFFENLRYLRNIQKVDIENILIVKQKKIKRSLLRIFFKLSILGLIPNNHANFDKVRKKIERIKPPKFKTEWGDYHTKLTNSELFKPDSRFGLIIECLKKYNIKNVLEIAGNQGKLSSQISKFADTVICSDYDEIAVDIMYKLAKQNRTNIYPVLLDFLSPININLYYSDKFSTIKRIKSEAVLALALTHHLLLTRKVPIDSILEALSNYTSKYLFVEFMPIGLNRGKIPDWYNIEWFRSNLGKHFQILEEFPSESNGSRVLFIGEKNN